MARKKLRVHRVVRTKKGPWWFSSNMGGRFDLPEPHGTCYVATEDLAALLEYVGPLLQAGIVAAGTLQNRRLRSLALPQKYRLADATARRAASFLTGEIHTMTPYTTPQRWAAAFHEAGFEGIRFFVRHDPSRTAQGYALFGKHGERTSWPRGVARKIGPNLCQRLEAASGIKVLARPGTSSLTIIKPP